MSKIMGRLLVLLFFSTLVTSCSGRYDALQYAFRAAGKNKNELMKVLEYYKDNPEKLAAAQYLIENMPGHESYLSDRIHDYYDIAYDVLSSDLTPVQQRDSLLHVSDNCFSGIGYNTVCDLKIVKADFLIHTIDLAFEQWKKRSWAQHLSFEQFCEWLLPYKVTEYQELDYWRDTLTAQLSWFVEHMVKDDDQYGTVFYTTDALRNGIRYKVHPVGMYNRSGYPLLRSDLLLRQTYGRCEDYVNLAVMTYRSFGIPCVIDETPYWGRYRAGHTWYVILTERGEKLKSEWDISSIPGYGFFQDKRIPKVFRHTYAINKERAYYKTHSKYKYPFDLCRIDVTDEYFTTSDVEIPIDEDIKLEEEFAYIASFSGPGEEWAIIDYGVVRKNKAIFKKMGRNVLYIVYGYNGNDLVPISKPFLLHIDGVIEFISYDTSKTIDFSIRRKYYQSNNVAKMRNRLLGGRVQCSLTPDFKEPITLFTINDLNFPDKIQVNTDQPYRYWRYLSPNGSYGSLAELAFFDSDTSIIKGTPISNTGDKGAISHAYDGDWLSNFETGQADGNWIGMDMGTPKSVAYVRIVPRGDDNDIHPDDEYHLRYWDETHGWVTCDIQVANDNVLHYKSLPRGALFWLHNNTRGLDERPFVVDSIGKINWW